VSYENRKGYSAEHEIEKYLIESGYERVYRPRAGQVNDVGDITGLSIVVSVKNHAKTALSQWVDDANLMGQRQDRPAVVWHKRRLKGHPRDWYVTMDGGTFMEIFQPYEKLLGL
jgi:hypothetical protein